MTQYPRKSNLHSSRLASHKMNPHMNWSVEKERDKFHLMLDNCQKTISRIRASEDWSSHPAFRIRHDVIVGQSQHAINAVSFTKNRHTNEKINKISDNCFRPYSKSNKYINNLKLFFYSKRTKRKLAQPRERIELSTPGLQDQCSNRWANEATTYHFCDPPIIVRTLPSLSPSEEQWPVFK